MIDSSKSQPSARIERGVLRLQPYEFTVMYRPGPQNIADALSRLTQEISNESKNVVEEYIRYVAENAAPRAIPILETKEAFAENEEIHRLGVRFHVKCHLASDVNKPGKFGYSSQPQRSE